MRLVGSMIQYSLTPWRAYSSRLSRQSIRDQAARTLLRCSQLQHASAPAPQLEIPDSRQDAKRGRLQAFSVQIYLVLKERFKDEI